jgi:hypothetical protein
MIGDKINTRVNFIVNKTIDLNETFNNSLDLTDPSLVITTWHDIRILVLIVGAICLITGYLIAKTHHYLEKKKGRKRK